MFKVKSLLRLSRGCVMGSVHSGSDEIYSKAPISKEPFCGLIVPVISTAILSYVIPLSMARDVLARL